MVLTSSQRARLRQIGQKMADDIHLGKAGLSAAFIGRLQRLLASKELVKLRFGREVQGPARQELAQQVAAAGEAQVAAVTGRTMLLYRANPDLDAAKRITI